MTKSSLLRVTLFNLKFVILYALIAVILSGFIDCDFPAFFILLVLYNFLLEKISGRVILLNRILLFIEVLLCIIAFYLNIFNGVGFYEAMLYVFFVRKINDIHPQPDDTKYPLIIGFFKSLLYFSPIFLWTRTNEFLTR